MRWQRAIGRVTAGGLALALVALLAPASVVACSCAAGIPVEDHIKASPNAALIVGQVMRDRGDGSYDFLVARWYGPAPREGLILQSARHDAGGGNVAFNTCGMEFTPGQRLLFLGEPGPEGRFAPNICGLSADPTTADGAEIERRAAQLLGPAQMPQPQPSDSPPNAGPSGGPDLALVGAGVAGAAAALFGLVILLGLRRRRDAV